MKITRKELIRIIKEELGEAMRFPSGHPGPGPRGPRPGDGARFSSKKPKRDELAITSKDDGSGWTLTGSFKGRKVDVDSSESGEKKLLSTPPDQIRFALARILLGYFFDKEGEGGLKVNEPMLQGVVITKDGTPIK